MADKSGILKELQTVSVKHPRGADILANQSRADACFAVMFKEGDPVCLKCTVKVEYAGKEMSMSELCKVFTEKLKTAQPERAPAEAPAAAAAVAATTAAPAPAHGASAERPDASAAAAPVETPPVADLPKDPPAEKKAKKEKVVKEKPAKKEKAAKPAKPVKEKKAKPEKANGVARAGSSRVRIVELLKKAALKSEDLAEKLGIGNRGVQLMLHKLMEEKLVTRVAEPEGRGFLYTSK